MTELGFLTNYFNRINFILDNYLSQYLFFIPFLFLELF